jgi:hypothetical protein
MPESLMRPRSASLRLVAVRLDEPELEALARKPGVIEAFRATVQYHDGRCPDQVATLTKLRGTDGGSLRVAYRRSNDKPLVFDVTIDARRYGIFGAGLRKLEFDRLDDMPEIPWSGADLWLLERASGTFHHDIIIPPDHATGLYAQIVSLVRDNLKEAVRTING